MALRRTRTNLVAIRAQKAESIGLLGAAGQTIAQPGDWIILQETYPIAVVPAAQFPPAEFEVVAEGALTIPRGACEVLEETTGVGTTRSAADLLAAVRRLASISIGEVRIAFTPGQLEELQHRAKKRGQTVEQAIGAVVSRIRDELFWKG